MKTKLLLFSLAILLLVPLTSSATHLNGGYISYQVDPQNPLKYKFTLTLFENAPSNVNEAYAQISMGDLRQVQVTLARHIDFWNQVDLAIFEWEHTYSQPGDYIVSWNGINRNRVVNTAQPSDLLSQYIYTQVKVRLTGLNSNSVRTIIPAHLEAFVGEPFKMNMIAYDADGDQLTYELVPPKHIDQNFIPQNLPGYQFPVGLYINMFGELHWQNPTEKGQYAISVKITEYKGQQSVGYTVVDLNIIVKERDHQPLVKLLNKDRLTVNYDGSVYAKPEQKLKLEFFVEKAPNSTYPLYVKQFSDLDTLDLATPELTARDSANGLAVTITLTPETSIARNEAYIIGIRGGALIYDNPAAVIKRYAYGYDFVSLYIGAQQPTSSGDLADEINLYVYPNPVADKLVVEGDKLHGSQLKVYNSNGQQIFTSELKAGKNTLVRPARVTAGMYVYHIVSSGKVLKAGKLVLE